MDLTQLYVDSIEPLSAADRLRLATMILNGISPEASFDESNEWTDEDCREFSEASWSRLDSAVDEVSRAEFR